MCDIVVNEHSEGNNNNYSALVIIIIIIILLHGLGHLTCSSIDIVSWGIHDLFFFEGLQLRACFGSLVLSILSRWLIQFCLYLSLTSYIAEISSSFLMTSFLILSCLVYPVTLLTKRISAASRPVMSLFVVTHISLPYSSDGLATTL